MFKKAQEFVSYLGVVVPASHLVDVAVDGSGEVDGERVTLAVSR